MTEMDLEEAEAAPVQPESSTPDRIGVVARVFAGRGLTFVAFTVVAAIIVLFAFRTVHSRPAAQLETDPGAKRTFSTITYWNENGYFASGGLMSFDNHLADPTGPPRVFYKSSSGAYMVSGYIIEKIAVLLTGRYQWKLLAIHNEILMLITGALIALLVFRLLKGIRVSPRDAVVFSLAVEGVFLTFPEVLAQYWELSAQPAALPFAILFLLFEDGTESVAARVLQSVSAFFLVYLESVFGCFFLATYVLFAVLIGGRAQTLRSVAAKTALPAAGALLLFALQIAWVRSHFPQVPLQGSEFLFRSGLDGSTQYYRDHIDILFGRDVARRNFPANRDQLFNWTGLFMCGTLATVFVIVAAARRIRLRAILLAILTLLGGYVLYGALFSQALVIHPYLYDLLVATPLILALFAFAPGIIGLRTRTSGVLALLTLLIAVWYSMVQMRHYAMWYPLPPPSKAARSGDVPESPVRATTHADRLVA